MCVHMCERVASGFCQCGLTSVTSALENWMRMFSLTCSPPVELCDDTKHQLTPAGVNKTEAASAAGKVLFPALRTLYLIRSLLLS